jgi:hypothetical protein
VSIRRVLLLALAVVAPAILGFRPLQAQTDIIRGRVTGPDSLPIEGVTVTATSIANNTNKQARTDKQGRFTISFPNGDGDYVVSFAALGFAARRFEVKRTADQDILVADTRLARAATVLDAVRVQVARDKVRRNDQAPDISGTERGVNPGGLPPDLQGDLAAMVSQLPGVQYIPGAEGAAGGFSVLGLGADQNNTTLNGLNFGGNNLPRDAQVGTSLVTTPYDVSRGGFSGGQISLRTRPGSNFIFRNTSAQIDAPSLQWTDRAAQALGQRYTNMSFGGGVSGPIRFDKAFYNVSYQVDRRMNDLQTLLNTNELGLKTAGIAKDSVARLLTLLGQSQIQPTMPGISSNKVNDRATMFGSLDFSPPSPTSGQAFNVAFSGNWRRSIPTLGGTGFTAELPAHGGDVHNWGASVQGRHTNYFGFGILTETTVGFASDRQSSEPYLSLPSGSVRINSTFDDGTSGVRTVQFGGSPSMSTSSSTTNVSALNQLSWFSANNKHRIKLTSELRHENYSRDNTTNQLGSFTYNSLADFQAGIPASFTRQLTPRRQAGGQVIGALSLGDSYRRSPDLQIQYGVRLDANRFTSTPQANAQVEQIFGAHNDDVPNKVYVSPRVGFSWTYGTAPQIPGFDGAIRGPRAVVRGGIGVFQNMVGTQSIGSALDNTGLPSGVQQLTCSGLATPIANWAAYQASLGAIPTTCADGTMGTVFASTLPNVTLFDESYVAPRSVRSNLQWNGAILGGRFTSTVEATYSRNLNQTGSIDLNFTPVQRFALADEGGRPVYVANTSISSTTGIIASRDARVSQLFNRVTSTRSDLQSEARQITFRLSPMSFSSSFGWGGGYTYSNSRELSRGFGAGNTVGNPLEKEWVRSQFDSRHQLTYNLSYNFFDFVRAQWYGSFRSGTPFTPVISGDVNGDGYGFNDRAFIFDPLRATDPTLAAGMRSLLDNGSGTARKCLEKQLGRLAERNSCQGPWTTNATLQFSFNPVKVRMPQRTSLSFTLSNPLTAVDVLMHGENKLHGWGQSVFPDQSLLYVRGFDAQTQRFKYDVNERFGATSVAQNTSRNPVVLTALFRVDVGPTRERQSLTMMLDRGRTTNGTKTPEQQLKMMYGSGGLPNPMQQILRQADTLQLTTVQADSIASLNRYYTVRLDSLWTPVAKYLSDLPETYDQGAAYDRYKVARQASVDLLIKLSPDIKSLLTPAQTRMMPAFVMSYLDKRFLSAIRSGTAGAGGPMMMMGDMGAVAAQAGGDHRMMIEIRR